MAERELKATKIMWVLISGALVSVIAGLAELSVLLGGVALAVGIITKYKGGY